MKQLTSFITLPAYITGCLEIALSLNKLHPHYPITLLYVVRTCQKNAANEAALTITRMATRFHWHNVPG